MGIFVSKKDRRDMSVEALPENLPSLGKQLLLRELQVVLALQPQLYMYSLERRKHILQRGMPPKGSKQKPRLRVERFVAEVRKVIDCTGMIPCLPA
jgi:hypothetical protein